jgi:hypothetical protein
MYPFIIDRDCEIVVWKSIGFFVLICLVMVSSFFILQHIQEHKCLQFETQPIEFEQANE